MKYAPVLNDFENHTDIRINCVSSVWCFSVCNTAGSGDVGRDISLCHSRMSGTHTVFLDYDADHSPFHIKPWKNIELTLGLLNSTN